MNYQLFSFRTEFNGDFSFWSIYNTNFCLFPDHLEYAMLYWQQCDSCEKYLPNERTLSKHKLISHQEGWAPRKFLCEFCSSAHTHSGSYYKHMMSKHLEDISKIWIKCKICETYLPTQVPHLYSNILQFIFWNDIFIFSLVVFIPKFTNHMLCYI